MCNIWKANVRHEKLFNLCSLHLSSFLTQWICFKQWTTLKWSMLNSFEISQVVLVGSTLTTAFSWSLKQQTGAHDHLYLEGQYRLDEIFEINEDLVIDADHWCFSCPKFHWCFMRFVLHCNRIETLKNKFNENFVLISQHQKSINILKILIKRIILQRKGIKSSLTKF